MTGITVIVHIPGDASECEIDARSMMPLDREMGMFKDLAISISIKLCEAPVSIRVLSILLCTNRNKPCGSDGMCIQGEGRDNAHSE